MGTNERMRKEYGLPVLSLRAPDLIRGVATEGRSECNERTAVDVSDQRERTIS